ncbi:MAG: hypothetical protein IIA87_05435 [Nanoarchaeota archaeon]|nr:hypothetical protein [Nanoarchaeota archaeon]
MYSVDRPIAEKTKSEIEKKLIGMGDYVKMSYLQRALKSGLDFDTKKFVLLRLAEIYETRKMYMESGRLIKVAGEINTTFKEKIKDYMKSVEMYIKGENYQEADRIFAQALVLGNEKEKLEMKNKLKDCYLTQAEFYLSIGRRNYARKVYEKLLTLDLEFDERKEMQKKLLELYEKLGCIREYYSLKNSMS